MLTEVGAEGVGRLERVARARLREGPTEAETLLVPPPNTSASWAWSGPTRDTDMVTLPPILYLTALLSSARTLSWSQCSSVMMNLHIVSWSGKGSTTILEYDCRLLMMRIGTYSQE